MTQLFMEGLKGERGLLAAVIATALRDATSARVSPEHRASAWAYLASWNYRDDLTALDLPAGWLPARIEQEAESYDAEEQSPVLANQ